MKNKEIRITMELFDIVDENGIPTGKTVERNVAHKDGIRHRSEHVWIARHTPTGTEVLMQKRAMIKDSFPGRFDTSSAGHIRAGENPLESAVRELKEELGLNVTTSDLNFIDTFVINYEKEFHGKLFKDSEIAFVYAYTKPVDINNLVYQIEEVETAEWFNLDYVIEECTKHNQKFCAPLNGLRLIRKYMQNN